MNQIQVLAANGKHLHRFAHTHGEWRVVDPIPARLLKQAGITAWPDPAEADPEQANLLRAFNPRTRTVLTIDQDGVQWYHLGDGLPAIRRVKFDGILDALTAAGKASIRSTDLQRLITARR